jgi:aryl-alcohol dehydrogenase-like predicted oxidoreductase
MIETLTALHELVQEGKVRYVGHSNLTAWKLAEAAHLAAENGLTPFISAQNHWSLLERDVEAELVPAAAHYGLGVLPYFPLAQGMLTGKVRSGEPLPEGSRIAARSHLVTDEKLNQAQALADWGAQNGRSLLEIAIGGLTARDVVGSVIAGATKPAQVDANVKAAQWQPSADELAAIDELVPPPVPASF